MRDIVSDALCAFESTFSETKCIHKKEFVETADWLIRRPEIIEKLPMSVFQHDIVPVFAGRNMLKTCKALMESNCCEITSAARLINIRSHWSRTGLTRTFYNTLGHGLLNCTAKLAINSREGCAIVSKEISNRQIVDEVGELLIPRIIDSGNLGSTTFILEEWVKGRLLSRSSDTLWFQDLLFPAMIRHYISYGVKVRNISESMSVSLLDDVEAATGLVEWPADWPTRQSFLAYLQSILVRGLGLPVSYCHADLNIGHLALDQAQRIMILDWDAASEMPVAADLIDLLMTWPNNKTQMYLACCRVLDQLTNRECVSVSEQLFLASLRRVHRWREFQQRFERQGQPHRLARMLKAALGFSIDILRISGKF